MSRRDAGFTYLAILFAVAILGGGLSLAGEVWHTTVVREREAELLHTGEEYRRAIERYYLSGPRQYPRALEDLLKDPRKPGIVRHLRKPYPDPVTGGEWAVVMGPDGGIAGVHSTSTATPIRVAAFPPRYRDFAMAKTYADWRFVYVPAVLPQAPKPGASSAAR